MKTFWLKVIASDRVAYNGRCQKVIVPAADGGQMGILADHENMIIAIEVGEAKMQMEDGTWETLAVGTGFLEVVNNRVTMLVQTAEKPEEIDARRAEERREVMEEKTSSEAEYPGILSHESIPGKSHEPVEGVKGEEYEDIMMPGLWECKARSNPWASCRYNKKKYSSLFSDMMNFADFAALSIKICTCKLA